MTHLQDDDALHLLVERSAYRMESKRKMQHNSNLLTFLLTVAEENHSQSSTNGSRVRIYSLSLLYSSYTCMLGQQPERRDLVAVSSFLVVNLNRTSQFSVTFQCRTEEQSTTPTTSTTITITITTLAASAAAAAAMSIAASRSMPAHCSSSKRVRFARLDSNRGLSIFSLINRTLL